MKRYKKDTIGKAHLLSLLIDYLQDEGVTEHTMLSFLIDEMNSEEGIEKMQKLAEECDIDLEEFWEDFD